MANQILIVDVDKDHSNALKKLLEEHSPSVTVLEGSANSLEQTELVKKQARQINELQAQNREYKQQVAQLQTGHGMHNQLFDEVPCYISVQDKDLKITRVNKRFKDHFGDTIGKYCYQIYKHRDTKCPECPVVQTFLDGKSHRTEEIVTSKSGKQYNVLTQTAPILDEKGQITQVMELSTNITQVRQLQDHLASLGLMLGSMFHSVKGTLTALDGGIYQLETGLEQDDTSKISHACDRIKSMTDKIKKMVLEILDYAKSRELRYETIQIADLVENVMETITPLAEKTGVSLKVSLPKKLKRIDVDIGWMAAALVNFLENGIEACQSETVDKKYLVSFCIKKEPQGMVSFTVSDNGQGMDPETKEKMFSLFFSSKGPQGTGLGMFISNRVIRYHGGSVQVDSTPGKGSKFYIRIPQYRPEKHQPSLLRERKLQY